jgi:hypothetical protein
MAITYTPIATQTLGSAAGSVTFSSIPATYTDLVLVTNFQQASGSTTCAIRFNGDTGTNYSMTVLSGSGVGAVSARSSSVDLIYVPYWSNTANTPIFSTHNIMNYSNTTTYKTVITRFGSTRASDSSMATVAEVDLWRSTSAINSIEVFGRSVNFNAGSTFTLYGIKAA